MRDIVVKAFDRATEVLRSVTLTIIATTRTLDHHMIYLLRLFGPHLLGRLPKHPRSISDDTIARAARVARVAQGEPVTPKTASPGFDQQAGHGPATSLARTQWPLQHAL